MSAALATAVTTAAQLPPHVAAADEPIPDPGIRLHGEGPDMRAAMSVQQMLADLSAFTDDQDDVGYVTRWREHFKSIGGSALVHYAKNGEVGLTIEMPVDPQVRHRNRWAHFLLEDLRAGEHRRDVLITLLLSARLFYDERPTDPAATTRAMRGFLRTGGRILLTPDGHVVEGIGAPRAFTHGTDGEAHEVVQAGRAYHDVRYRFRADQQIKRAVRLLGHRTANGWIVLEARA